MGLVHRVHHGHHEGMDAGVEQALEMAGIVARHADHGIATAGLDRAYAFQHVLDVDRRVLAVDEDDVVAGQGIDLAGRRRAGEDPGAEEFLAGLGAALDAVADHSVSLRW